MFLNSRVELKKFKKKPKVETIEKLAKEWELLKREIISRRKLPRPFPKKQGKDHVAVQPPLADIAPMVTEKSLKFADKRPRWESYKGWFIQSFVTQIIETKILANVRRIPFKI